MQEERARSINDYRNQVIMHFENCDLTNKLTDLSFTLYCIGCSIILLCQRSRQGQPKDLNHKAASGGL